MSQIILDCGSGNTCKNDLAYAERMVDTVIDLDTGKHEIIFKWQLWNPGNPQGKNIRLKKDVFACIYKYLEEKGYRCTASVFDKDSLEFLLQFDVPFIKIACRPDIYWLIGEVPRKIPVYVSIKNWMVEVKSNNIVKLCCVSEYPAKRELYYLHFNNKYMNYFSDHTEGLALYKEYHPGIYECHFVLDDSTGLDVGSWAKRPRELTEIL